MRGKRIWICDLDGTVYRGSELLPGATDLLGKAALRHERVFMTNNSSRSRKDCRQHLQQLGVPCEAHEIETSVGDFLKPDWAQLKRVFVVGTDSLVTELANHGFSFHTQEPELVIVSFDAELTFEKLAIASRLIASGTPWVQTHPDKFRPTSFGSIS